MNIVLKSYEAYNAIQWDGNVLITKESLDEKFSVERKNAVSLSEIKKLQEYYDCLLKDKDLINMFIIGNKGKNKWIIAQWYAQSDAILWSLNNCLNPTPGYEEQYKRYKKVFDELNVNQAIRAANLVAGFDVQYKHSSINIYAFICIIEMLIKDECKLLRDTNCDIDTIIKNVQTNNPFFYDENNSFTEEECAVGVLAILGINNSKALFATNEFYSDCCTISSALITNKKYRDMLPDPEAMIFKMKMILAEEK